MQLGNLPQLIFGGLSSGAIYALVALGLSMIYKSTGILSFAQGSVLMIGGYTSVLTVVGLNLPYPIAVLGVALSGVVIGLILCWLSFRPLRVPSTSRWSWPLWRLA